MNALSDYYVYALQDPRTQTSFYIGKGRGARAFVHARKEARGREPNPRKAAVLAAIRTAGLKPVVKMIAAGLAEGEAFDLERRSIAECRDSLTNIAPGSMSAIEKSKLQAKYLLEKVMDFDVWCSISQRTDAAKSMYRAVVSALRDAALGVPLKRTGGCNAI